MNSLLDNYLKELLLIEAGRQFLIRAAASEVYSIKLLDQLKVFLMEKNQSQVSQFSLTYNILLHFCDC